jgi:hypothetical protein
MEEGMNPQERQVIDGVFDRLKNVANQPRDPEAERYIGDLVQKQPYATYALAQSVYVQEQALLNQQQQIEQLQAEVAELRARPQQPASGGGFLSGLFGGGSQQRPPENVPAYGQRREAPLQAPAGPWGGQPQAAAPGPWGQPQRQGMGFLGTAAAAATGVAGGMVLGSILSSALGGGAANAAAAAGPSGHTPQENAPQEEEQGHDNVSDASWDDGGYGDDSFEA